jgi:hypothetical protein
MPAFSFSELDYCRGKASSGTGKLVRASRIYLCELLAVVNCITALILEAHEALSLYIVICTCGVIIDSGP